MSKFEVGDRVRCIAPDNWGDRFIVRGDTLTVGPEQNGAHSFRCEDGGVFWNHCFELAAKAPAAPVFPEPPAGLLDFVRENRMEALDTPIDGWVAGYCEGLEEVLRRFYGLKTTFAPATVTFEAA